MNPNSITTGATNGGITFASTGDGAIARITSSQTYSEAIAVRQRAIREETLTGMMGQSFADEDELVTSMSDLEPFTSNRPEMDKKLLKTRHLSKQERDMLHNPASDWCETNKGEVCKNACTLEIADLLGVKRK